MKVDATPRTLLLLGVLAAFKAGGLVLLAEGVATGIVGAIAGDDVTGAVRLTIAAGILRAVASWATQVVATRAAIAAKSRLRGDLVERVLRGNAGSVGTLTAIGTEIGRAHV